MSYREYAAQVSYWWGVHQYAARLEEAERQRRRAERLPVRFRDDVWERYKFKRWDGARLRWETAYDWRARC